MKAPIRVSVALILATAVALPVAVHAGPEFLPYEGRNAIHEGQGGERKTVDGVDFWFDGAPPHRFQVLGVITDRRRKNGLIGAIRMHSLDPDIAKLVKGAGGDAVILTEREDEVVGVSGFGNAYAWGNGNSANAFGSSFAAPVKELNSRYTVVKYLPDAAPESDATLGVQVPTPPAQPAQPSSAGTPNQPPLVSPAPPK